MIARGQLRSGGCTALPASGQELPVRFRPQLPRTSPHANRGPAASRHPRRREFDQSCVLLIQEDAGSNAQNRHNLSPWRIVCIGRRESRPSQFDSQTVSMTP